MLDEFPSLGYFAHMSTWLATLRSKGVSITYIIQDLGQLVKKYGEEDAYSMIEHCDIQILLGTNDVRTAEYFSTISGLSTVEQENINIQRLSESVSLSRRPVLTVDEVQRLNDEELLIKIRGYNILKLRKNHFYQMPQYEETQKDRIYSQYHVPLWLKKEFWQRAKLEGESVFSSDGYAYDVEDDTVMTMGAEPVCDIYTEEERQEIIRQYKQFMSGDEDEDTTGTAGSSEGDDNSGKGRGSSEGSNAKRQDNVRQDNVNQSKGSNTGSDTPAMINDDNFS